MGFSYFFDTSANQLHIQLTDTASFFAMKRSFSISFEHIVLPIIANPEAARRVFLGFHWGTRIPGIFNAGTFYSLDMPSNMRKTFIYMRRPDRTIQINTVNEDFKRLILEVPNDFMDLEEEANRLTQLIEKSQ
ncbi:hypothetical protein FB192DRAFT_1403229 [Mucor lusitanicus]|uniref:Uncharacterized protein n=1 Tax=Mucor circinelloides f. lusitanicus TaxID=29924 RepID=A0A8H4B7D6_MUCCL|nr:hypothetical protein FB192DRAFT_1403229 [Mucor lusitanicus]